MQLINPKFEIIEQKEGLKGMYQQIEKAGRTCYKSEDRITEDSAKEFVERMIKSEHGAMLEHGTVYLMIDDIVDEYGRVFRKDRKGDYKYNKYSKVNYIHYTEIPNKIQSEFCDEIYRTKEYITTNLRVLVENDWMEDLQYLCEPTEYHERRVTVRFTTEIGITREFNRHRVNSPAEESTRYCNYSKDKFGNEISVILPQDISEDQIIKSEKEFSYYYWSDTCSEPCEDSAFRGMCKTISDGCDDDFNDIDAWLFGNLACQWSYFKLIKAGWKAQMARKVLPLDLKSELIHTAFVSDWEHFFKLRDAGSAHPDAQLLAHPLHEEFIKRNYIKNNEND